MNIQPITPQFAIADQPRLEDFERIRAAGYHSLINARPDGEDDSQMGDRREALAAQACGLAYAFVPVKGSAITRADVRAFQAAMAAATGPVVAHCKGGTRALSLYLRGEVLDGRMTIAEVEAMATALGRDLGGAIAWLRRETTQAPLVEGFYDPRSFSVQYIVADPETRACAIIDPVLDYDEKSGSLGTQSADALLAYIAAQDLRLEWILDTHPHADHLSAAAYLKSKTGVQTAIGAKVTEVQKLWQEIYAWPELATDGRQWDRLFADGDSFTIGNMTARVIHSPGHTLASVTYLVGDAAFVHDTLFMPDSGSARADFPGGSAKALWQSIGRILALPDTTRIFTGHDYCPGGRHPRWESTVAAQKAENPHVRDRSEKDFVALREARDATLPMPKLILHALQVNIEGGRLPAPDAQGRAFLKLPLGALSTKVW